MAVTPYFDDGKCTLYLGNCLEITEWLCADVLCTDPPYGRNWQQGNLKRRQRGRSDAHPGIQADRDTTVRDAVLDLWGSDRPAVVFGDLMLAPPRGAKITLIYRKPPNAGARGAIGGYRRDAEAIYLLGGWPSGIGGRTSILHTGARVQGSPTGTSTRYGHPHAKPVDLLEELLATCPPGVIADPFAGSGSTLIAARNLGRSAIGVEIDERYAEAAARRLSQPIIDFPSSPASG